MPVSDLLLSETLQDVLHAIRHYSGMEVAFISEFEHGRRVFRYVDAEASFSPISVGHSDPLEESYCQRVADGRLPESIPNARENAEAMTLPVTALLPVGAHLSVPIRLEGGEVFGTLCCFQRDPNYALDQRDADFMHVYAEFIGKALTRERESKAMREVLHGRLRAVLDNEQYYAVYQPIVFVNENRVVGHEVLTRFTPEPLRPPDKWFADAEKVGLQAELELAVIRKALANFHRFPRDTYLSFNVSPGTVLQGRLPAVLEGYPLERVVLEITEHVSIDDYSGVAQALKGLRANGLRLAVDDAGAGFASFRHIIKLNPDIIKLDISLVREIDKDRCIRALAAAIVRFADETGSKVVAEGVETREELAVLRELQVNKAQGFLLGRPSPVEQLVFGERGAS